jgi:amidase
MTQYNENDILKLSALRQAQAIREGDFSSTHLVEIYLTRISEYNETLQAFVNVHAEQGLKAAKKADLTRSRLPASELPIFHGVPTGIKDLVPTKWSSTHLGSRAYKYFISPFDAPVTKLIKAGGFISLGKLATSEFGVMPVTEPDIHPPTRNPWDTSRTSGGSSGGSSAAVAANLLPIAQGSDGGGSVRIPSAFTHLYGFKPSLSLLGNLHGAYNRLGISVMGPLARYVEDAAAMLDVMAGHHTQVIKPGSCLSAAQKMPKNLRIRLLTDTPIGTIDSNILAPIRDFADSLRSLGHTVEEGPAAKVSIKEFLPIWQYSVSGIHTLSDRYVQPITRWVRKNGQSVTFDMAEARRLALVKRIEDSFGDVDILMSPTVPSVAPLIGAYDLLTDPKQAFYEAANLGSLTAAFNLTHGPAASLPIGLTDDGLPFGVQIGAYPGQDNLLLSLSRQIEDHLPWHNRRAPKYCSP